MDKYNILLSMILGYGVLFETSGAFSISLFY